MKKPKLKLIGTSSSTTYKFKTERNDGWGGWAHCTINDETDELLITSDWGDWSHRWPGNWGDVSGLTEFIGSKSDYQYIALKLIGGHRESNVTDWDATLKAMKQEIKERYKHEKQLPELIRWLESIWNNYGNSEDLFLHHIYELKTEDDKTVFEEPWHYIQTKPSDEYRALIDFILPALARACKKVAAQRKKMVVSPAIDSHAVEEASNG